jgi:hypothetical protein
MPHAKAATALGFILLTKFSCNKRATKKRHIFEGNAVIDSENAEKYFFVQLRTF